MGDWQRSNLRKGAVISIELRWPDSALEGHQCEWAAVRGVPPPPSPNDSLLLLFTLEALAHFRDFSLKYWTIFGHLRLRLEQKCKVPNTNLPGVAGCMTLS